MNYEKKYKEVLEKAKNAIEVNQAIPDIVECVESLFPELKESDGERIMKAIEYAIGQSTHSDGILINGISSEEALAWLEKQWASVPDWMPKFLDELRSKKNYFDWDEHKDIEGEILSIINWMNPNYFNGKDGKQIPANKVESKFKAGNWYQCTKDFFGKGVTFDKNTAYYCAKEGCLQNEYGCHIAIVKDLYDNFRLWTIQDAKDGDVLTYITDEEDLWIMIYRSLYEPYEGHVHYHALLVNDDFGDKGTCCVCIDNLKPATKEQRDLLFQKMKEASYEWDAEKKELKTDEEVNGEDYGIDSLYHAQRILEKTLGSVDGYQSDDGILEHKCAISAVKKLYEQKPAEWSKEDEKQARQIERIVHDAGCSQKLQKRIADWFKSIKDRVQPQSQWKPSDEMMGALWDSIKHNLHLHPVLKSLYQDLKKLREE